MGPPFAAEMGASVTRPFESVVRDCSSIAAGAREVEPVVLFAGEREDERLIEEEEVAWLKTPAGGRGPERGEC